MDTRSRRRRARNGDRLPRAARPPPRGAAYLDSAEIVDRGSDASGEWTQWRIVERPRLGPFRYTIRFPARVTRTSPTSLRSSVIAAPGCTLVSTTEADVTDAGSRVSETVMVSAPWMLVAYMHRHALLAHRRTYAALPGVLADDGVR